MSEPRRNFREEVAEELIQAIENGTAPWMRPWEPGKVELEPYNPVSHVAYRGINNLWLSFVGGTKGYNDPRWMTYKQAASIGAQVRKGEKGALVEYWQWRQQEDVLDQDGKPVLDENGQQKRQFVQLEKPRVFRAVVFNGTQIDGLEPLPTPELKFDPIDEAEKLLAGSGVTIRHDQRDSAHYIPKTDEIHLPPQGQFKSAYAYYSTALHEVGHATGHESRLKREFGAFGTELYAREELRAEISSYMVARRLGIGHDPSSHATYAEHWLKALREDRNEIFRAARDADTIQRWVMEPEMRQDLERAARASAEPERSTEPQQESGRKIFLTVPEQDRSEVQQLGARWDKEANRYYAPEQADALALMPWFGKDVWEKAQAELRGEIKARLGVDLASVAEFERLPTGFYSAFPHGLPLAQISEDAAPDKPRLWTPPSVALNEAERNRLSDRMSYIEELDQYVHETAMEGGGPRQDSSKDGRAYLSVSAADERDVMQKGPYWDSEQRRWFVYEGMEGFDQWKRPARELHYLNVPFHEKNEAKALGAKWDKEEKSWYAPDADTLAKLAKWAGPQQEAAETKQSQQVPEAETGLTKPNALQVVRMGDYYELYGKDALAVAEALDLSVVKRDGVPMASIPVHFAKGYFTKLERKGLSVEVVDNEAKPKRQYLAVPFEAKDEAKALGAKFDRRAKAWFVPDGADPAAFEKWKLASQARVAGQVSPQEEFAAELEKHGLAVKGAPAMDGKWHRVALQDDRKGDMNGSYRGFLDGRPAGQIMNYKTMDKPAQWVAAGVALTREDRAALSAESAAVKAQVEAEIEARKEETARRAFGIFTNAPEVALRTPYLLRKEVGAYGLKQGRGGDVLVPLRDIDGRLWNFQAISDDGEKRFLSGGRKQGLMHVLDTEGIKDKQKPIIIAEGYATAASVLEATGAPAVVAFDKGNLKPVAEAIRNQHPDRTIIIAADDDHKQEVKSGRNPGKEHAEQAALAVGGFAVAPRLSREEKDRGLSDFNDLARERGLESVKEAFATHMKARGNARKTPEHGREGMAL